MSNTMPYNSEEWRDQFNKEFTYTVKGNHQGKQIEYERLRIDEAWKIRNFIEDLLSKAYRAGEENLKRELLKNQIDAVKVDIMTHRILDKKPRKVIDIELLNEEKELREKCPECLGKNDECGVCGGKGYIIWKETGISFINH